jgi:hypothetical protein
MTESPIKAMGTIQKKLPQKMGEPKFSAPVIPAKAGIQWRQYITCCVHWIPAFAGMTITVRTAFCALFFLVSSSDFQKVPKGEVTCPNR